LGCVAGYPVSFEATWRFFS